MKERMLVVGAAFLLDVLFGDPEHMWHPVRGIGSLIEYLEKILQKIFNIRDTREEDKAKKRIAGTLLVIFVVVLSTGIPALILYGAYRFNPWLRVILESLMCYWMLAMKSLRTESMRVYYALKSGDVERARYAVSRIVGRDTEQLSEEGIIKAAVETVAENTSDGVTAPLMYMCLFGAPGVFFYKAVNTLDSMVGYKNDKYIYMGTVAARLDDILNFIPARISALFMIVTAYLTGMDAKNAWKIFMRDRYNHASPNSAQTEAVCAGALSIQLAGDAYYFGKLYQKPTIGDGLRSVETEDIRRANRLMYGTSLIIVVVIELVLFVLLCT